MKKERFEQATRANYDLTKELSDEFSERVKFILDLGIHKLEHKNIKSTNDLMNLIYRLNSVHRLHLQLKEKFFSKNIVDIIMMSESDDVVAFYYSDRLKIEFDNSLKYDLSQFENEAHFLSENQQLAMCKKALKTGIKDSKGCHQVVVLYDESNDVYTLVRRTNSKIVYQLKDYGVTWDYADKD